MRRQKTFRPERFWQCGRRRFCGNAFQRPGILAYVVFAMEAIGGVLLVLGVRTREVAAALIRILVGTLWVQAGNGWVFSNAGGGWEYPLYLIVLSETQVLLGEGAFAVSRSSALSRRAVAQLTT